MFEKEIIQTHAIIIILLIVLNTYRLTDYWRLARAAPPDELPDTHCILFIII